jgi:tetratricopeptide (TPR) repeat protein
VRAEASGERSITIAGDNYGSALTGDNARVVALPPEALRPAAEVDAPPGLDNLPTRPYLFVGRASELDRLDAALAVPGQTVVQAVHGLGGIGKSTLAAHWAATRAHGHAPIRWINADSEASIQKGLADLATALQPALAEALPAEMLSERAMQWLATHTGWLLILDNVNDPADIAPLLARPATGCFLITSRLAAPWRYATTVIRLDILDKAESLDLLTRITTAAGSLDLDGAADLCAELGHLPLAIEQAAAYLVQTRITPRSYLALLANYPAEMFSQAAEGTAAERTIARIWRASMDKLADTPLAGDILRILAWYGPEPLPRRVLDVLPGSPYVQHAIGRLAAYHLIIVDSNTLTVHRLVQAVSRAPDHNDPHRGETDIQTARNRATALLHQSTEKKENPAWSVWRQLIPHVLALIGNADVQTDTATTAHLLVHAATYLRTQGRLSSAIETYQRAFGACVRVLGMDHGMTLSARRGLAEANREAGHVKQAIALLREDLADSERFLGLDHRYTLDSRGLLAYAYSSAGDLDQAIPLFEESLRETERVLGMDAPETVASRHNLGYAYETAGDLKRAIPLYEQALAESLRVRGNAQGTLTVRCNLTSALREAGKLGQALVIVQGLDTDAAQALGKDHPTVLKARYEIAACEVAAGRFDTARQIYETLVADDSRVLGKDHPHTLSARGSLAMTYAWTSDFQQAAQLLESCVLDSRRILGDDHPDTINESANLAIVYHRMGRVSEAIVLLEKTVADCDRALSRNHPSALASRRILGDMHRLAGETDQAIAILKNTLDRVQSTPEEQPDTTEMKECLANAYYSAAMFDAAVPLIDEVLDAREQSLGTEDPKVLELRNTRAMTLLAAGKHEQAISALELNLAHRTRVLGKRATSTLVSSYNLAYAHAVHGNTSDALAHYESVWRDCERGLGSEHWLTRMVLGSLATLRDQGET